MDIPVETLPHRRRFNLMRLISFAVVIGMIALFVVGMVNRSPPQVERGAAPQFSIPLFGGGTATS